MTLQVKDLKVGDVFFEYDYGETACCEVLSDAIYIPESGHELNVEGYKDGWYCSVRNTETGEMFPFFSKCGYEYLMKITGIKK